MKRLRKPDFEDFRLAPILSRLNFIHTSSIVVKHTLGFLPEDITHKVFFINSKSKIPTPYNSLLKALAKYMGLTLYKQTVLNDDDTYGNRFTVIGADSLVGLYLSLFLGIYEDIENYLDGRKLLYRKFTKALRKRGRKPKGHSNALSSKARTTYINAIILQVNTLLESTLSNPTFKLNFKVVKELTNYYKVHKGLKTTNKRRIYG